MKDRGLILVISGPSGAGKGSIIKPYRKKHPECQYSVSITTRAPREEDIPGVTYHFKNKAEVEELIANNGLLEWDSYCDNYYGTPTKFVEDAVAAGDDCILEITVPGALQVKKNSPESVMIFIAPPSMEVLKERLQGRGTEDADTISKRMDKAEWEMKQIEHYDYVIINDDLHVAISELEAIVTAEKKRYCRYIQSLKNKGLIQEA